MDLKEEPAWWAGQMGISWTHSWVKVFPFAFRF